MNVSAFWLILVATGAPCFYKRSHGWPKAGKLIQ